VTCGAWPFSLSPCPSPGASWGRTTAGRRSRRRRRSASRCPRRATRRTRRVGAVRRPGARGADRRGLANNLNVKIAAANVQQAAAVLTQTRSPLYRRRATGRAPPARGRTRRPGRSTATRRCRRQLELDLWGRIRRLTEAARAQVLATEEARRGVILSLVSGVANTYLQLRALDEQLVIATRTSRPTRSRSGSSSCSSSTASSRDDRGAGSPASTRPRRPSSRRSSRRSLRSRTPSRSFSDETLARGRGQAIRALSLPPCRRASRPRCWSSGPTSGRPSSSWWRRTRRLAPRGAVLPEHLAHRCAGDRQPGPRQAVQRAERHLELPGLDRRALFTGGPSRRRSGRRRRPARRRSWRTGRRSRAPSPTWTARCRPGQAGRAAGAEGAVAAARSTRGWRASSSTAASRRISRSSRQSSSSSGELNEVQLRASLFAATVNLYAAMGGGGCTRRSAGRSRRPAAAA